MSKDRTGVPLSCPALDSAIAGIEEARGINDELRYVANTALDDVDDLREQIKVLLDDVDDLREQIKVLEDELSQYI